MEFRQIQGFWKAKNNPTASSQIFQDFFTIEAFFHSFFIVLVKDKKKTTVKICLNRKGKKAFFPIPIFYLLFPCAYLENTQNFLSMFYYPLDMCPGLKPQEQERQWTCVEGSTLNRSMAKQSIALKY